MKDELHFMNNAGPGALKKGPLLWTVDFMLALVLKYRPPLPRLDFDQGKRLKDKPSERQARRSHIIRHQLTGPSLDFHLADPRDAQLGVKADAIKRPGIPNGCLGSRKAAAKKRGEDTAEESITGENNVHGQHDYQHFTSTIFDQLRGNSWLLMRSTECSAPDTTPYACLTVAMLMPDHDATGATIPEAAKATPDLEHKMPVIDWFYAPRLSAAFSHFWANQALSSSKLSTSSGDDPGKLHPPSSVSVNYLTSAYLSHGISTNDDML
ncbi:hypothetical protein CcaCcLH18_12033 [Colletotrichum camelliae]|nr:hypothetical protein CcaCcLH18_12033 [Colletotrichum camelliae]